MPEKDHPFLTGVAKKGEPGEPEVWMLDHPAKDRFKIAIKWTSYKDDKPFTDYVLKHCVNDPIRERHQPLNNFGVEFEHRMFAGSNWYSTKIWLNNSLKTVIAKAFDEAGITLGCWPAEKDPEKAFVCGLKDNDLKFFPLPKDEKGHAVGVVPGSGVLMEKDAGYDDMPEFPKLSDVEKEMAMQEATDSLAKAVFAADGETVQDVIDQMDRDDRRDPSLATREPGTREEIRALQKNIRNSMADAALEKVKPCPYCGAAGHASVFSMREGYFSVLCLTCEARGPKALEAKVAVEKWNNRNFTAE